MAPGSLRLPIVALAAGSLLLAGCGQRLDPDTRRTLVQQSLGNDAQSTGVQGGPAGSSTGTTNGGTSSVPGGSTTAGSVATAGPAAGPSSGPRVGASQPAGGNGGATDIGVTATSITVGTVADQTGPQPGLFNGDIAGVLAYFAYVNSQGGVYGRTLKATVADSGIDCNSTSNAYKALADKVFAFVGNLSVYDNCGVAVLKARPKLPDVSYELTSEHASSATTYSVQPSVPGQREGGPLAFAKAYPQVKTKVGALVADVAAARSNWVTEKAMLKALGFTIVYEQTVSATEVDYTRYVIGMRQAGVQMAQMFNSVSNIAKFVNSARQQGFKPPVITALSSTYDPTLAKAIGTDVDNVYSEQTTALFFDPAAGRQTPGVGLFQDWMKRTAPDQAVDFFSVVGWAQAQLFVQALKAAGPRATQASLLSALKNTHNVDTGGLLASGDPGARKPVNCFMIARYNKGVWQRFTPSSGFDCTKPYYFAK